MGKKIVIEGELLLALKLGNQYTVKEICKIFDCSKSVVERNLYKYDIPAFWPDKYKISEEELRKMYYEDNMTVLEMANKLGCSKTGMRYKFERFGIKIKDNYRVGRSKSIQCRKALSETKKRLYAEGKIKPWNKNKTHDDDDRILIGENHPDFCGKIIFPICPNCGKIFEVSCGYYNHSIKNNNLMHCSRACAAKNTFEPKFGEDNPNWRGGTSNELYDSNWEIIRKIAIEYWGNICHACGNKNNICVHHIDYDKKNNNILNLIPLCISCHGKTGYHREIWKRLFYCDEVNPLPESGYYEFMDEHWSKMTDEREEELLYYSV